MTFCFNSILLLSITYSLQASPLGVGGTEKILISPCLEFYRELALRLDYLLLFYNSSCNALKPTTHSWLNVLKHLLINKRRAMLLFKTCCNLLNATEPVFILVQHVAVLTFQVTLHKSKRQPSLIRNY